MNTFLVPAENSNGTRFEVIQENRTSRTLTFDRIPDVCPICNNGIDSRIIYGYRKIEKSHYAQVLFQCPRDFCHSLFIGYYEGSRENYHFVSARPIDYPDKEFSEEIVLISESFTTIYNEAREAEERGLVQICGAGYRKSLEFLIKDYAINTTDDEKIREQIKSMWLSQVIKEYIHHEQIKSVAEKATWLGNDETHYYREWTDMDVNDLKDLINLTVTWIEMDLRTRAFEEKMSSRKNNEKEEA